MPVKSAPLSIIIKAKDVPPPPPIGTKMVYDLKSPPGTSYGYGFSSVMGFDDDGWYVWGGSPTHEGYFIGNRNGIYRWRPPAIGTPGDGTFETLFARNPMHGWAATDEFVRWIIPGYNWWTQFPGQVIFDMPTKTILASNIAALQAAAGDPVEDIPPMDSLVEMAGLVQTNTSSNAGSFAPYEPAHAWSRDHDVGITIGGSHTHYQGTFIEKVSSPDGVRKLRVKVWMLPDSLKHPTFGWPCKAMRRGAAFGDWFYVFGAQQSAPYNIGIVRLPIWNLRFHIPTIKALAPNAKLPESAVQWLPQTQGLWPEDGSVAYVHEGLISHNYRRGTFIDFNYRVIEIKPHDDVTRIEYADVTPDGYPTIAQIIGGYDRATDAHYLSNGILPPVLNCTNLLRPRVNDATSGGPYNANTFQTLIGEPDPSIPLVTPGNPAFQAMTRFHRIRFV